MPQAEYVPPIDDPKIIRNSNGKVESTITLVELFAMNALSGLISADGEQGAENYARRAYEIADAMLLERDRRNQARIEGLQALDK